MAISQGTSVTNVNTTNWNELVDAINANTVITGALSSELQSLTDAEIQQLQNINAVTITNGQWTVLGGLAGTLTAAEVNFLDGVTSAIQTQLDAKAADADVLKKDGSVALTSNWDAGSFTITATQLVSDIAIGTAPLVVTSTTVVSNLNADQVDGKDSTDLVLVDGTQALTGDWDAGSFEIRAQTLEADVTTGTAPLTIASTTKVSNLNVDQVDGYDLDQAVLIASNVIHASITVGNTGLHVEDTNATHDLIIKPESDLTADRTLSITTGDQDRAVVLSNYAGIYFDGNAVVTTILLVDAYEPITVFDSDMPEVISNGDNTNNNITIGETGDYEVHQKTTASGAAATKVFAIDIFEIAASGDTITGATQATPCVITAVGHSLSNGNLVKISGVSGMTELNGQIYTVTNAGADTFELEDDNGTDINSGAYGGYTSGGTAYLATKLDAVHSHRSFGGIGIIGSMSGSGIASLTANNTLEMHAKNETDGNNLTVENGQLWIKRL
jgi:hypothetical protein